MASLLWAVPSPPALSDAHGLFVTLPSRSNAKSVTERRLLRLYVRSSSAHLLHMPMSGYFIHLACPSAKAKLLPSLWTCVFGS